MKYVSESNSLELSVDELSTFAYQKNNSNSLVEKFGFTKVIETADETGHSDGSLTEEDRISSSVSSIASKYNNYIETTYTDVPLEITIDTEDDFDIVLRGNSDILSFDGEKYISESIYPLKRIYSNTTPFSFPEKFARSSMIALMFMKISDVSVISMRITFVSKENGERVTYEASFTREFLSHMLDAFIDRAKPYIMFSTDSHRILKDEIKAMPFPYQNIREGQEKFVKEAYRTIIHGESLFVSAPTGIGKTMSSLFPAIKALAAEKIDKVFYFTSKTITGKVAADGLAVINQYAPHLRTCIIYSKEMLCTQKHKFMPGLDSKCRKCDLISDIEDLDGSVKSYKERELNAIKNLMNSGITIFTPALFSKTAEEYDVCPYELALDVSELCHVIICDCNYVIDESVRLKRYFKDNVNNLKYALLFDEAHNLPDRTRNTYSAEISSKDIDAALEHVEDVLPYSDYQMYLKELRDSLESIRKQCTEHEHVKTINGEEVECGYAELKDIPVDLKEKISRLLKLIYENRSSVEEVEALLPFYSKTYKFLRNSEKFNDKFRLFCTREGKSVRVQLLCIDPSEIISTMLSVASSVIFFSATLTPIDYYQDVTGFNNSNILELDSPYDKENLCIVTYDSISTRYNDRLKTAEECAQVVAATVSAKDGNYIIYFPSYDYMNKVCRLFAKMMPDCGIVLQKPGMSYKERQKFIDLFKDKRRGSVVGFCVLGGMFSEGIDLGGESLIGVVIIGCGMPQLSAERNLVSMYYDEKSEHGYEYAYIYPGLNKVLQAAGRVIRSEADTGVVVMIDDRYNDPKLKYLFPSHWKHMKYTGNLNSLEVILEDFWENNQ